MNHPEIKTGCLTSLLFWLVIGCIPPAVVPIPDPINPPVVIVPTSDLRVLLVRETDENRKPPAAQLAIFSSVEVRTWLRDHKIQYRAWDDDINPQRESKPWQEMLAMPRSSLPWIVISGPKSFSGPLPADVPSMLALLKEKLQ